MRALINRYLTREVIQAWVAVTAVLLFILLSNQFAQVLGDAAAGKLPREAVLQIIGLSSISYLTILVPIGLFLAVMLAMGRLYMDSEMTAINACGLGPLRIYQPIAVVSIVLSLVLAWLSLYVSPWAMGKAQIITQKSSQQAGLSALEPGRFLADSGVVFYAEGRNPDGTLLNVFLQRRRGDQIELALAESGEVRRDAKETTIILRNGQRYEGEPGTLGFRIVRFAEHGIPVMAQSEEVTSVRREAQSTRELLKSDLPADAAELHWRLSAPISAMLLGLLAVPLSRTRPRQGRYGKIGIGIAVYLVYANLLGAAQVWVHQGTLSPRVGMWPVHGLLAAAAVLLLWRATHLRKPRRGKPS